MILREVSSARGVRLLGLSSVLMVAALIPSAGQSLEAGYTKTEYRIPMRDGVHLFTGVYTPKDTSRKHPILLTRTPYSLNPYGNKGFQGSFSALRPFVERGYVLVFQDVRGRYMSEGEFVDVRPYIVKSVDRHRVDESSDTYDTIDWLVKNVPDNNGKVGIWGISYPGFYASSGSIDSHPALKASSPQAPVSDWFRGDDWHHQGAFMMWDAFSFYNGFGRPHPGPQESYPPGTPMEYTDGYKFFLDLGPLRNVNERYYHHELAFWDDLMKHGTLDSWWKDRIVLPKLKNIHSAVMTVGGWFDAEDLYGTLKTYHHIETQNPGIHNTLVMGPWIHGGWLRTDGDHLADISFGSKTHDYYMDKIFVPFFDHYLNGGPDPKLPEALVFDTGNNQWRSFNQWPPERWTQDLFFTSRSLVPVLPSKLGMYNEYVSDPANPVPYAAKVDARRSNEYMIEDQRFASKRRDVVTFESMSASEDFTIAGPITADLYVSTTGTDADFVVKVIDEFPENAPPGWNGAKMGGYQMLVRAEVHRAKFRYSFERPEPLHPGRIEHIRFDLPDVCHTFLRGHKTIVQIQSSWFPLVDRNPQTFTDIYSAPESAFQKSEIRIYHTRQYPSHISVGVISPRPSM